MRLDTTPGAEEKSVTLPEIDPLKSNLAIHLSSLQSNLLPLSASGSPVPLFETIEVSLYGPGSASPLPSVAQLTDKDGGEFVVLSAFDPGSVKELAKQVSENKTLQESLGSLNPSVDESKSEVVVKVPKMNADRRKNLVDAAKRHKEAYVKDVRGTRKRFMDDAKRAVKDGISKDDGKRR